MNNLLGCNGKIPADGGYDFASAIRGLATARRQMPSVGTAGSHFQDEPFYLGNVYPASDWEHELEESLAGHPSCVLCKPKLVDMPTFLPNASEYVERAAGLGMQMFRTSFDWARLCPRPGQFNERLMRQYMRVCVDLHLRQIEPLICLNHFTMPLWLCGRDAASRVNVGAWEHPEVLEHFRYFVESVTAWTSNRSVLSAIAREAGANSAQQDMLTNFGLVRYWMTLNEPIMPVVQGYLAGTSPPFKRLRLSTARKVMGAMVDAHDAAFETLKSAGMHLPVGVQPQVGIGYNWQYWDGPFGGLVHKAVNEWWYADLFEGDGSHSDFLGLHYYFHQTAGFHSRHGREYGSHPGFGDIYPRGIGHVLRKMHRAYPDKEILVSEIGFADPAQGRGVPLDQCRPFWLLETVRHILDAIASGIPVRAILAWTLVDSFEWHHGMSVPFGLMTIDDFCRPAPGFNEGERIRSFDCWQALALALREPNNANLVRLQHAYEQAETLHDHYRLECTD
jgi:beta-glucosidase